MTMLRLTLAVVLAAGAVFSGLSVEWILGAVLAVDLAQFGLVLDHRGRLSAVEEAVTNG